MAETDLHDAAYYLAFAGLPTFWRTEHTRSLDGADIVVMGVPFDAGTSNRPGARLGPRALREISLHTGNFHHPWPSDVRQHLRVIDYGDVGLGVSTDNTRFMIQDSFEHARRILASGARLLTLGGDHTIPYGLVRAAREQFGPVALVHFDSHQDTLSGKGGQAVFHGTFAHDLAAEGAIDPLHSVQVFIRTDMPNEMNYPILYAHRALHMHPREVAAEIKRNVGDRPVYLTFDIDALDPAFAPGTGTPVPGGPSTAFVREVLWNLEGIDVVAADVVEVAPAYDSSQITALAGATVAGDLIHLLAAAKVARRQQVHADDQ